MQTTVPACSVITDWESILDHYKFRKEKLLCVVTDHPGSVRGDRGCTVVKVLCYKSEGLWFDPSWCQWIFH